jgi:hypothetical protein
MSAKLLISSSTIDASVFHVLLLQLHPTSSTLKKKGETSLSQAN